MSTSGLMSGADIKERLRWHRQMQLIREVEQRLSAASLSGELPGPVHVSVGQEAIAVGVCSALQGEDWVASTHRGHGHFLARGGTTRSLVAEIFGKATGACRGRGGSMHVADLSRGILGAQGIVGAGIGLATGAALTSRTVGHGGVAVAFFGDGGANQGLLLEALNLGAVWKLPLLLVCENNGWSEFTATQSLTAGSIADRATPFGIPNATIDGNDVEAVHAATEAAAALARRGEGPSLLEMRTYRIHGHVETEVAFLGRAYRSDDEIAEWRNRDPIAMDQERLLKAGVIASTFDEIRASVEQEVDDAFSYAATSPFPDPATAEDGANATAIL